MKHLHKILMGSGVTLCLGIGITSAIIAAQPKEQLSDLTLANIEAMARDKENDQHATIDCYGVGELRCPIGGVCETYTVTDNSN